MRVRWGVSGIGTTCLVDVKIFALSGRAVAIDDSRRSLPSSTCLHNKVGFLHFVLYSSCASYSYPYWWGCTRADMLN